MGRGRRRMTNSSFSSISFDAETAIKFKKLAKEQEKTHTELLEIIMNAQPTYWRKSPAQILKDKNELME